MAFRTFTHTVSNENFDEEVEIVYGRGFFRWFFKLPPRKEVYIGNGTVWHNKKTGERAGIFKEYEIYEVVKLFKQSKRYVEWA